MVPETEKKRTHRSIKAFESNVKVLEPDCRRERVGRGGRLRAPVTGKSASDSEPPRSVTRLFYDHPVPDSAPTLRATTHSVQGRIGWHTSSLRCARFLGIIRVPRKGDVQHSTSFDN